MYRNKKVSEKPKEKVKFESPIFKWIQSKSIVKEDHYFYGIYNISCSNCGSSPSFNVSNSIPQCKKCFLYFKYQKPAETKALELKIVDEMFSLDETITLEKGSVPSSPLQITNEETSDTRSYFVIHKGEQDWNNGKRNTTTAQYYFYHQIIVPFQNWIMFASSEEQIPFFSFKCTVKDYIEKICYLFSPTMTFDGLYYWHFEFIHFDIKVTNPYDLLYVDNIVPVMSNNDQIQLQRQYSSWWIPIQYSDQMYENIMD